MKPVVMIAVFFASIPAIVAEEKPKANARRAVEGYVAAALAGKVEDARALAVEGQSPGRKERIEDFKKLVDPKVLKIVTVRQCDKNGRAIAVSEGITLTKANPDGTDTGPVVFLLNRVGDKWLVKDIDFRSEEKALERVKSFVKRYPEAK